MKNNYLVIVNDAYVPYAKSLIYSIHEFNKDYCVYLYLVNSDATNIFLETKYNLVVETISEPFSKEEIHPKRRRQPECYSEEAAFCANVRATLLLSTIKKYHLTNLTYVDADSLIRAPVSHLCPEQYDIAIYKKKETKYYSGIISVNVNPNSIGFLKHLKAGIDSYGLTTWFSDQNALKDSCMQLSTVHFFYLPLENFDWYCRLESNIWMGKGKLKSNPEYIVLQQTYLDLF